MTRSLYIIGGAGVGKSTFMSYLGSMLGWEFGPLADLHAKRNAKALVTLRGHEISSPDTKDGLYLGVNRDAFPGSDGLDRATSPTGEEWLQRYDLPPIIVAEGATLATRRFLFALQAETELLVLHLTCDEMIHDLRLASRGTGQEPSFVQATVTKSENLVRDLEKDGVRVVPVQTEDTQSWVDNLNLAANYLKEA